MIIVPPASREWLDSTDSAFLAVADTGVNRRAFFLGRDKWLPFPGFLTDGAERGAFDPLDDYPTSEDMDADDFEPEHFDDYDEPDSDPDDDESMAECYGPEKGAVLYRLQMEYVAHNQAVGPHECVGWCQANWLMEQRREAAEKARAVS
jgi:hypothetical protein